VEASDDPAPEQSGGEIDLSEIDLSEVKQPERATWKVETHDSTISLETVSGGTVEMRASEYSPNEIFTKGSIKPEASRETRSFNQKVIIIVLVVLGVGFLAVVGRGVIEGTLDFQAYTIFVLSLLAAFGFNSVGGGKGQSKGKKNDTS
jgi:hypothetical protein